MSSARRTPREASRGGSRRGIREGGVSPKSQHQPQNGFTPTISGSSRKPKRALPGTRLYLQQQQKHLQESGTKAWFLADEQDEEEDTREGLGESEVPEKKEDKGFSSSQMRRGVPQQEAEKKRPRRVGGEGTNSEAKRTMLSESDHFYLSFGKKVMSEDVRDRLMGATEKQQQKSDPKAAVASHKGNIPDLVAWFDNTDYDPRSLKEKEEQRRREKEEEEKNKVKANMWSMQQKLIGLSSVMRGEMQIFVDYLLDYGMRTQASATATSKRLMELQRSQTYDPEADEGDENEQSVRSTRGGRAGGAGRKGKGGKGASGKDEPSKTGTDPLSLQHAIIDGNLPSCQMYMQLRDCFEILDLDTSGTITVDELRRASFILDRGDAYDDKTFRNLDYNRSGSIDFIELLRIFFPKAAIRQLMKINFLFGKPYEKYPGGIIPARERLAPADLAEIDALFDRCHQMEQEQFGLSSPPVQGGVGGNNNSGGNSVTAGAGVLNLPNLGSGGGFSAFGVTTTTTTAGGGGGGMQPPPPLSSLEMVQSVRFEDSSRPFSSKEEEPLIQQHPYPPPLSMGGGGGAGEDSSTGLFSPRSRGGGGAESTSTPQVSTSYVGSSGLATSSRRRISRTGGAAGSTVGTSRNKNKTTNQLTLAELKNRRKITVGTMIEVLGLHDQKEKVMALMSLNDQDQDGEINLNEFTEMMKHSYPPYCGPRPGEEETQSLAWLAKRRDRDPTTFALPKLKVHVPQVPPDLKLDHAKAPAPVEEDAKAKRRRLKLEKEQQEFIQSKAAALQTSSNVASPRVLTNLTPAWQERVRRGESRVGGGGGSSANTTPRAQGNGSSLNGGSHYLSSSALDLRLGDDGVQISDDFRFLLQGGSRGGGSSGAGGGAGVHRPVTVDSLVDNGRPIYLSSALANYATPIPPPPSASPPLPKPAQTARSALTSSNHGVGGLGSQRGYQPERSEGGGRLSISSTSPGSPRGAAPSSVEVL